MYVPSFTAVGDEIELRAMVAAWRTGWLVGADADGVPVATLLPVIWRDATVYAHMARANPQWRSFGADVPVLLICAGPQAYVSPTWYPSKAEHGKVVPTWNYSAVHITGTVVVHEDPRWLRQAVTELTDLHEQDRTPRWRVSDAPEPYVDRELRGIVGIELRVNRVEGKAKLSQNRSDADRAGVVRGLRAEAHPEATSVADAVAEAMTHPTPR